MTASGSCAPTTTCTTSRASLASRRPTGGTVLRRVPQPPVVVDPLVVAGDAVRLVDRLLVAGSVVPLGAPRGDREVGPQVRHPERAQVHVRRPPAVIGQQRVGGARVAVADDEAVDGRWLRELGPGGPAPPHLLRGN